MSVISNSSLNTVLDDVTKFHLRMVGTQASGYGLGRLTSLGAREAWGAATIVDTLDTDLVAVASLEPIVEIGDAVLNLETGFIPNNISASVLSSLLQAIQTHLTGAGLSGVSSINGYLSYYNTGLGGTWQVLQHPGFKDLYDAWSPSSCLDPWNAYYEVLQGVTHYDGTVFTNALGKFVVSGAGAGALTAGVSIDGTKYSGGTAQVRVSGLAGSGVVTVTGTEYNPVTKATATGKTWTATVSGNGVTTLTPGTANASAKILAVSAVSVAVGITAGTIYVEAARPAGRPLLP